MLKAKRDQNDPDVAVRLDGLTDEPPQRFMSRLMTWAGVALLMMGAAIMAARSETGAQRIAKLFTPAPPVQQAQRGEPQRQVVSDPMLLYETRRLAEQVRFLAAEREALVERVASVERTVGDVTASIPRGEQAGAAPRSEPAPPRPVRIIETSPPQPAAASQPAPQASAPTSAPTAAPVPTPSPVAAAPATPTPAPQPAAPQAAAPQAPAPQAGAAPAAEAQDSVAIRTEFGVDLAGEASVEALRSRWQQLRNQHGPLLEGLRPLVAIQEGARAGAVDLRLIAGPLSNANAATRLCASLSSAGVNCKPAVFDGQRLALR